MLVNLHPNTYKTSQLSVRTHLFMILCLYKMCVCVVTDAVRLCTLQSIVFPKLIILFTITKLLLPLDANTLPTWNTEYTRIIPTKTQLTKYLNRIFQQKIFQKKYQTKGLVLREQDT